MADSRERRGLVAELAVTPDSTTVAAGGSVTGVVRAKNTGTNVWLSSDVPLGPVLFGVHLFDTDHLPIERDHVRIPLPNGDVAPGSTVETRFEIPAPATPGTYSLEFDLVAEHVCWFEINEIADGADRDHRHGLDDVRAAATSRSSPTARPATTTSCSTRSSAASCSRRRGEVDPTGAGQLAGRGTHGSTTVRSGCSACTCRRTSSRAAISIPVRRRKLLLHAKQIIELESAVNEQGVALVPLRVYFKDGRVKVELAIARASAPTTSARRSPSATRNERPNAR